MWWALSISALGYALGNAVFPVTFAALLLVFDWRMLWVLAAVMVAVAFPVVLSLLRAERTPQSLAEDSSSVGMGGRHWTRGEMLRHPLFWLIIPGILVPSFILTAIFFLPAHISEVKGWDFTAMPVRYWAYAITSVLSALAFGWAIDRLSARACLTAYQLPMVMALIVLWWGNDVATATLVLVLCGITTGGASTVHTAIWAWTFPNKGFGWPVTAWAFPRFLRGSIWPGRFPASSTSDRHLNRRLLLCCAVDATTNLTDRIDIEQDDFAIGIEPLQRPARLRVSFPVAELSRDHATIADIIIHI